MVSATCHLAYVAVALDPQLLHYCFYLFLFSSTGICPVLMKNLIFIPMLMIILGKDFYLRTKPFTRLFRIPFMLKCMNALKK